MKNLFRDPALLIQCLKIFVASSFLLTSFAFSESSNSKPLLQNNQNLLLAKKDKAVDDQPKVKKEKKSKKKKGTTTETSIRKNSLTNEKGRKLIHYSFETPKALEPAVEFWKNIYTKYDKRFEVFHDTKNLAIIYSVLNFSDLYESAYVLSEEVRAVRSERVKAEKERIRNVLLSLSSKTSEDPRTKEEDEIYQLFKNDRNPEKFYAATEEGRIRSQTGIKDKFMTGIEISGAYMEEIEDIFTSYGLPVELTRMVFVESMFNTKAKSKVGASGIWQFMPGTGKLYLNINSIADERNDPILASHAAAKLLKANYDALGTWPLAINAYNSGRVTMSRAVDAMGTTDISQIIQYYNQGIYGFASRNFYPCFLAALEAANHYPEYVGEVKKLSPKPHEYYYLETPQTFEQVASMTRTDLGELMFMNPHFSDRVVNGSQKIPEGYAVRVPKGGQRQFTQTEKPSSKESMISDLAPEKETSRSGASPKTDLPAIEGISTEP